LSISITYLILFIGGIAQLVERLLCKQEGLGSNPNVSNMTFYFYGTFNVLSCKSFSSVSYIGKMKESRKNSEQNDKNKIESILFPFFQRSFVSNITPMVKNNIEKKKP
jgi:hypothetical protein